MAYTLVRRIHRIFLEEACSLSRTDLLHDAKVRSKGSEGGGTRDQDEGRRVLGLRGIGTFSFPRLTLLLFTA